MRIIFFILISIGILFSKSVDVDIKAQSFSADKKNNIIHFKGQVSMVKGLDTLVCDDLTVYLKNENNETIAYKYVAIGKVSFTLKKTNTIIIGNGDQVVYDMDKKQYIIIGNGYLEDTDAKRIIKGDKIFIDDLTGKTKIEGKENKPVEFKFKMKAKE